MGQSGTQSDPGKFLSLFENMADGVFYQSADGALTEVNRAALELFGLTREEFLSRTSYDPGWYVIREDGTEVPPDEHPSMQAFRTGKPVSGVVLGVRNFRSNDIVWLIVNAVPMTGAESGRVEQVFVTLHDISNRRLLEERLRSSEERLILALESVNEGVWDWDLSTGSVFRNDRFYTMLGYAPGAIPETYHGWRAFVHPEDISGAENALRQCLSSSSSSLYETEFRMRDAEGAWRWILSRGRVVAWDPDGAPVRMIGTHTDITERKESEKALQQAAHEWRLTFDAVGSGIFLLDTEMKIIRANKAFAALVGGRVDGIAGSCCWELVHAERQPHPDCPMKRMLRTGKPESAEIAVGTRRYHATVDPICDDNGVVIGAVHGMRDITERAAMIDRLAQNELLLSNAERLAHIGSFQSDAETGAMVWSRELYRILEVPEYLPPLTFEAIAALAHPEDAVQLTQLAGGGAEVRTDVRLTLPSGARKTLRLVAQPLLDEQGRTIGTSGTLMDVTNEARASAELRRNEERLSALLRISSMEYASEQELIEWSLEAVVTLTQSEGGYFHLFDEETQCITLTAWSSAVRRDCSVSADTHYPLARAGVWADSIRNRDVVIHNDYAALREKNALPDGHFPLIRHLGVPVFDGERIVAAAGVANKESPYDESDIRDMLVFLGDAWKIIARRRAEQRLAESESAYRSIFEGSLDGIFRISADGRIERANPAFAHILGHDSPEELIGKSVVDYWDNPHDRSVYLALLLDKKEVRNYPFLLRRSDGAVRHVKVSATMVRNGQNEYIASEGILRDITDQVLMQAQLQHAQKMEAVGRLAGGIAHDFNNILSAISGFASLPLMHGQVSDEERSTLQQILALADKASILTKGLLAFSRKQILSMKDIDLNRILDVSAKLIGRLIGEDIALSVRKADVPLPVLADSGQIEHVLMNLATNARDAMPAGGRLSIEAGRTSLSADEVEGLAAGEYAWLSVSDTGCGIAPEHLEKIFEPFFTTKDAGKGTGLGLASAYGIMQQHKGAIRVESHVGSGTTFLLYLPMSSTAEEAMGDPAAVPVAGGAETILLVEDDEPLRRITARMLSLQGYTVVEAKNGSEAITVCEQAGGKIDLMLADVVMPELGGLEAWLAIREQYPAVKALFMSGYISDESKHAAMEQLGVSCITKPFDPRRMLMAVRKELDRD